MMSWMCRVLILVFMFYIVAPDMLQAQAVSRQNIERRVTAQVGQLNKPLSQAQTGEELDQIYDAQAADLAAKYDAVEVTAENPNYQKLYQLITQRHQLEKDYYVSVEKFYPGKHSPYPFALDYQIGSDPRASIKETEKKLTKDFLDGVRKAEVDVIDLLETLDPFSIPYAKEQALGNWERIGYSAEIIYNTLLALEKRKEDLQSFRPYLPHIFIRAMHSLQNLPSQPADFQNVVLATVEHNHENLIMARGTLRTLIDQVLFLIQKSGLPKPQPPSGYSFVDFEYFTNFNVEIGRMRGNELTVPGSREMQLMDLEIQYAVRYAVQAKRPQKLEELISILLVGERPKWSDLYKRYIPTKFETKFLSSLTSLFATLSISAQGSYISEDTLRKIFDFLIKLSGPEYATSVRVLALGTAGELNRSASPALQAYAKKVRAKDFANEMRLAGTPITPPYVPPTDTKKPYPLSSDQSELLTRYAVDLYHPLTNTFYGMRSYGLTSKQMASLADNLAVTIANLNNELDAETLNNSQTPVVLTAPGVEIKDRWPLRIKGSDGNIHTIEKYAPRNQQKADEEAGLALVKFIASWLAWDAAFFLLGQALKYVGGLTVGLIKSAAFGAKVTKFELSQSWKVARTVAKTTRQGTPTGRVAAQTANVAQAGGRTQILISPNVVRSSFKKGGNAFVANMNMSWRYMAPNFEKELTGRGLSLATQRAEQVIVNAAEMEAAPAGVSMVDAGTSAVVGPTSWSVAAPVYRQGTGYLFGRSTQQGAQGLFGRFSNVITENTPAVESYLVTSVRPGFQKVSISLNAAQMGLEGGLNNPYSRKIFMRYLNRHAQRFPAFGKLSAEELNQIGLEKQFLNLIGIDLGMNLSANGLNSGAFDFWAFDGQTFAKITPKDFMERYNILQQSASRVAKTTGGNLNLPNYFEVLGVERTATKKEIQAAFRELSQAYHPDKFTGAISQAQKRLAEATTEAERKIAQAELEALEAQVKEAEDLFKKINEAYSFLCTEGQTIRLTVNGAQKTLTRADYEELLDKMLASQGTQAGAMPIFSSAFPQAPNGFYLAISPKNATNIEPVVSAMHAPGFPAGGFGIGPGQLLRGDFAGQFAQHLLYTAQLPALTGLSLRNYSFLSRVGIYVLWGAPMYFLAALHAPARDRQINEVYLTQYQQELDKYGNMFRPVKPTNPLENVVPQTPDFWSQIQNLPSQKGKPEDILGSTTQLMTSVPRMRSGKIHIVSDFTKTLLAIQAKQIV